MLKAQQQALYQNANQQLLAIRNSEIQYYSNYLGTYSDLAALSASLIINTVTQVQAYSYSNVDRPLKSWFWMSCVITICLGMHCTIVASVTLVYGLGLAIKGPLGSVVRAVQGMKKASKIVFQTFMLSMLFFGITNLATFWMVAYQREAYICTAIMITCGVLTYYHTTEILHRFYWRETDNDAMEFSEMSSSTSQKVKSGISSPMLTETLLESQRSPIGGMKDIPVESSVDGKEEDLFEGYVAVKREGASFLAMGSSGGGWERYYCVLSDRHLWWYRDKRAFDMEPDHPAKSRPLDLEYYTPVPAHTTGGSARQLRIKLRSKTSNDIKEWKLQLDTQEEYNQWMEHLSKACA